MAVDITLVAHPVSGVNASAYTFSSQSLGAAAADREIIVSAVAGGNSGGITSISIAGTNGAVALAAFGNADSIGGIYIRLVPTGTTGTIVVTYDTGHDRCGIAVWRATGLLSETPFATATDLVSAANAFAASLAIPTNGGGIGYALMNDAGVGSSTWTNLTEQFDEVLEGGEATHTGALSLTGGTSTRTATDTNPPGDSRACFMLASWSPSLSAVMKRPVRNLYLAR